MARAKGAELTVIKFGWSVTFWELHSIINARKRNVANVAYKGAIVPVDLI